MTLIEIHFISLFLYVYSVFLPPQTMRSGGYYVLTLSCCLGPVILSSAGRASPSHTCSHRSIIWLRTWSLLLLCQRWRSYV